MIHDVQKYIFIGVDEEIDHFFSKAQQKGFIQFIPPSGKKMIEVPKSLTELTGAISILRKQPVPKAVIYESEQSGKEIAKQIVQSKAAVEKLIEEQRILRNELSRINPFGDFSLNEIREIEQKAGKIIQFFAMKEAVSHKVNVPEELIYLTTEFDIDYFMSISPHIINVQGMAEMHFEKSLGEIKGRLDHLFVEIRKEEEELKASARFLPLLRNTLIEAINGHALEFAKNEITGHLNGALFAVEGWIPSNKVSQIKELLEGLAIQADQVEIEPTDSIPTYMENEGFNRLGEDLVHIYDVPATEDKDPSGWVFWAFVVFFSMIVADAGYGLIFIGLAYFMRWKWKGIKGLGKRVLKIFLVLSWGCFIWGILIGSYFGIEFSPESPWKRYSFLEFLTVQKAKYHIKMQDDVYERWVTAYPALKQTKSPVEFLMGAKEIKEGKVNYQIIQEFNDNILLEFSILLGVIHISLSLLRYYKRNWSGIGWCAFIIGGYLYFPSMLKATSLLNFLGILSKPISETIGMQLLFGGAAVAIVLALIQKKWKGLAEAAHVIQIFADILSYLRIYALGLAAMIMAGTFNQLGKEVGLVGGLVIVLLGHIVNITLAIMGGIIHGLRLNFIEWYHYSFEGDGKLFRPLKLREK